MRNATVQSSLIKVWGIIILFCLVACSEKEYRTDSTKEMVQWLSSKREEAYASGAYPYFTDKIYLKLKKQLQEVPSVMSSSIVLDFSLVSILKGDNLGAIEAIESYLELDEGWENFQIDGSNLDYVKILALAYLRQAELINCQTNHQAESCVFPLENGGIHQDKGPAYNAHKVYKELVAYDSKDSQSRFFCSLSKMALGDEPDREDSLWMSSDIFLEKSNFPRFNNIAGAIGVSTRDHAGGSIIDDFNEDGLLDIFTTSYSLEDETRLYINSGEGYFNDQTTEAGLKGLVGGLNCIQGDFNGDGRLDIYVMRGAWLGDNGKIPNSLLINLGEGKFSDQTKTSGLYREEPTGSVAAADIDLDGDLDLFVGNESARSSYPANLFINQGDGVFVDQAEAYGLKLESFVKGAIWGDVNADGYPDLFLSNYGATNQLFISVRDEKGGVSFEDKSDEWKVSNPVYSFTSWFWDYNQDGYLDLFVSSYDNRNSFLLSAYYYDEVVGKKKPFNRPYVFKNVEGKYFEEVGEALGLQESIYTMGGNFGDINMDSYPDFYCGTGEFNIWASVPNKMYLNIEGKGFEDVTYSGGFGQIQKGHGVSFGDIDNDGDQDIYHQVGGAAESDVFDNMLFENPGFASNHWIGLKLQGESANTAAIGTKVAVYVSGKEGESDTFYHWVSSGGSFGASSLRLDIGLGSFNQIDSLRVFWPDQKGSTQVFKEVEVNRQYRLVQGESLNMWALPSIQWQYNGVKSSDHAHH